MRKITSRLLAAVIACLLCITMIAPITVSAASQKKVTINTIKSGTTLTVGSQKSLGVKANTKSTLSYKSSNAKVVSVKKGKLTAQRPGSAKITVTASPKSKKYKKTSKSITIKVVPQKPGTPSGKRKGKNITAVVKGIKYATGYQFQYATNKSMSGAKSKAVKAPTYSFSASAAKAYYIRVRAYTKTGGKTYYSGWSSVRTVPKASAATSTPSEPQKPTECKHAWDAGKITKQPTCTAAGVKTYTCTKCKATKTEAVAATGKHNWNGGAVTKQPTCAAAGVKTYTCTVCGATKTEAVPATGNHSWDGGKITKQPTCKDAGVKTYTCPVCGTTKTESIPATGQHAWELRSENAPTCVNQGAKQYACKVCGLTKNEYTDPVGHKWVEHPEEGHYEPRVEYISAQVCNTCGKGYVARILLAGHYLTENEVVAAGYEVVEDDATAAIIHNATSDGCENYSVKKVPVPAIEHEQVYVVDRPAYSECSVCGATK